MDLPIKLPPIFVLNTKEVELSIAGAIAISMWLVETLYKKQSKQDNNLKGDFYD